MVTSTGVIIPARLWVRPLNCFTNSMMLTPWGPRAVPTGGAGVACPAATWSFTTAAIALAISILACVRAGRTTTAPVVGSMRLELQVVQFHRGRPAEQRHRDPHLALVGDHLFDRARELRERSLGDLHDLADQERNLLLRLLLLHRLLDAEAAIHFFGAERHPHPAPPPQPDHPLPAVEDVGRFLVQ